MKIQELISLLEKSKDVIFYLADSGIEVQLKDCEGHLEDHYLIIDIPEDVGEAYVE
jgi:hypothetical protein